MKIKCKLCGREFNGRKDAKFCSTKCRVKFLRLKRKTEQETLDRYRSSETKSNVTDNLVLVEQIYTTETTKENVTEKLAFIKLHYRDVEFFIKNAWKFYEAFNEYHFKTNMVAKILEVKGGEKPEEVLSNILKLIKNRKIPKVIH